MIKGKVLKCRNFISQKGNACTAVTVILSNNEIVNIFEYSSLELSTGSEVQLEIIAGKNLIPQLKIVRG